MRVGSLSPCQSSVLGKWPTTLKTCRSTAEAHEGDKEPLDRPAKGPLCKGLPDGSQVTVVVHNVEVGHSAVALLFPGLILHLLQGYPLSEGINAQDLRGLQRQHRKEER